MYGGRFAAGRGRKQEGKGWRQGERMKGRGRGKGGK